MSPKSQKKATLYFLCLFIFLGASCGINKKISHKLSKEFKTSAVLKNTAFGFALYDLQDEKMIFEKDASKYFVPASNTKLFTFYTVLKMLPQKIAALRYEERNDSLIFWGTGDPSFLQTELKDRSALNFLKASNKKLFFSPGRYVGNKFGPGWAWDDYNDYFQAEISELPIMDNTVQVTGNSEGSFSISPKTFTSCFIKDSANSNNFFVKRDLLKNEFHYSNSAPAANYQERIPYSLNSQTTLNLLADTLHAFVGLVNIPMPKNAKTILGADRDAVLTEMLLPSDNFIAEQLILLCSNQISDTLQTKKTIDYALNTYLKTLPDKPNWVDGSGLSRMNLFTPRDIIKILELIYKEVNNPSKLFAMLPAGGKAGTIKYAYPKTDNPFVFAKTGTLTGVHNQSGYVITKKGKTYLFSFMNNNFVDSTSAIRAEIVKTITLIHNNF
ncbi:D-alanyl-D-alanine carboxypeptidase/D-alanyl-D-alanine-endopeptidase (penicillin-binding protein 4) [Pedobacter sp. UYP30]|uniref:D-alanyl-D-alanine carboxypeptidase/D-alanyl-D-alanine-endopeptidase n=1 Tax=Pedobacter sp. UYP30 TaxID=1756400 RepID=UPI003392C9F3